MPSGKLVFEENVDRQPPRNGQKLNQRHLLMNLYGVHVHVVTSRWLSRNSQSLAPWIGGPRAQQSIAFAAAHIRQVGTSARWRVCVCVCVTKYGTVLAESHLPVFAIVAGHSTR